MKEEIVAVQEVMEGNVKSATSATVMDISLGIVKRSKIDAIDVMELATSPKTVTRHLMSLHATTVASLVILQESAPNPTLVVEGLIALATTAISLVTWLVIVQKAAGSVTYVVRLAIYQKIAQKMTELFNFLHYLHV